MESLVWWKKRVDKLQEGDNVCNDLDQVSDFDEQGYVDLTGSPTKVSFVMKDETNAETMKRLKFKGWWR